MSTDASPVNRIMREKVPEFLWEVQDNREMGEKPMRSRRCKGGVTGRRSL